MIEIRRMTAADVEQVAALEIKCFRDPWSKMSIASELENEIALWLVAVDGDMIAGYVGSQTVLGETDMMNIAVHPDYRRRGIAEELLLELIVQLRNSGSHCLSLEVRDSNCPARCLYEKLGFFQAGRRPGYYQNPKEDALILRKEWGA